MLSANSQIIGVGVSEREKECVCMRVCECKNMRVRECVCQ